MLLFMEPGGVLLLYLTASSCPYEMVPLVRGVNGSTRVTDHDLYVVR